MNKLRNMPVEAEPSDFTQVGDNAENELRIYLRYRMFRGLDGFVIKDTSHKIAGILLGTHSKDGKWVKIDMAVELNGYSDSFSDEDWEKSIRKAASQMPGYEVVGWFCSHPNAGVEPSAQEERAHGFFFNDPWKVLYIIDPVSHDRRFHIWNEDNLAMARGYRIFGREEKTAGREEKSANMTEQRGSRPYENLRERHLENSVDNINRKLDRRPPVRRVDYLIGGLVLLLIFLVLLKPAPTAKVDQKEVLAQQEKILASISALDERMSKIEEHLNAVGVIDSQLNLPSGNLSESPVKTESKAKIEQEEPVSSEKASAKSETIAEAKPEPSPAPVNDDTGVLTGAKVVLHTVDDGEMLSSICSKYYGTSDAATIDALGKYNQLSSDFELYPGDVLKIPDRASLKKGGQ